MLDYIKILRPKNLLIIALSQVLIYILYFHKYLDGIITLRNELWILFVIDTILIAGAGYVINDIFDSRSDIINKKDKTYIQYGRISPNAAKVYYNLLVFVGFLIAWYIAYCIDKIHLLVIYPIAVGLLYMYSYKWKGKVLIGNIVVAVFCAFVPGIVLYAEIDSLVLLKSQYPALYVELSSLFIGYILFAFLSTMIREIIKDIEDIQGDLKAGYTTLPIGYGITRSKGIALVFAICLLASFYYWVVPFGIEDNLMLTLILTTLVGPTLFIIQMILKASKKKDYTLISSSLKILMIVSLFVFLCIPFIK